jgi:glucose-6-phosphate 1-dehydrogenase
MTIAPITVTATPASPITDTQAHDARTPEPCVVVIFGASGDLTKRKLLPALHALLQEQLMPQNFAIVGFARKAMTDDVFRKDMRDGCTQYGRHKPKTDAEWDALAGSVYYHQGDYDSPESYLALKAHLDEIDKKHGTVGNRLFYLSTPPSTFPIAVKHLAEQGLINPSAVGPTTRVIIEKPFGTDLASAQSLNAHCLKHLREDQIFRIDHYLGKETVQNLMVFRFGNALFEPLWNNKYIDHVQITGAEAIGIEGRGGYFDGAGIMRDMVQNHLFQVLCLTAMEPPATLSANDLRDEKVKVLKALRPIPQGRLDEFVVRAQYKAGGVAKPIPNYTAETGVAPTSTTETFVAMKLFIDNWRWAGVPFFLRSGKAMQKKVTEVALVFKETPHRLFGEKSSPEPNILVIRIQPDEGISIRFGSKVPGNTLDIHPVNMDFRYGTSFGVEPPEAYERLLLDCMLGDAALYTRGDEVEASWRFISRIHESWARRAARNIPSYDANTWGPAEADVLLAKSGHIWRRP